MIGGISRGVFPPRGEGVRRVQAAQNAVVLSEAFGYRAVYGRRAARIEYLARPICPALVEGRHQDRAAAADGLHERVNDRVRPAFDIAELAQRAVHHYVHPFFDAERLKVLHKLVLADGVCLRLVHAQCGQPPAYLICGGAPGLEHHTPVLGAVLFVRIEYAEGCGGPVPVKHAEGVGLSVLHIDRHI